MLNDFITQFNWMDIVVLIIISRISYIAMRTGVMTEVFKFGGVICAIYISSHYYTVVSDYTKQYTAGLIPIEILDLLSFIFLVIIGYLIGVLLRSICRTFFKLDSPSIINRWLGLTLGIFRGYLISGIVVFAMVISGITYLNNSSVHSYFGKQLSEIQPGVYTWLWNNIGSKLIKSEKLNSVVGQIKGDIK